MHTVSFIALVAAGVTVFWSPIAILMQFVNRSELYSHIPLIPLVTAYFLVIERKNTFDDAGWDCWKGAVVLGIAALVRWFGPTCLPNANPNDCLSLHMLGFVIWVEGSFVFSYGVPAIKRAAFPMAFLAFLIPIPTFMVNPLIRFLQRGSAEAAYWVIKALHVPFYRDGFVFALPGFTVEVAEQCSGIRSSIALFITAIVAGKLFLRGGWARAVLALSIFPITMFKNALRIVTLAMLASYVDPRFVTRSWLHSSGGIPFFAVGLLLLLPVVLILRKTEKSRRSEG